MSMFTNTTTQLKEVVAESPNKHARAKWENAAVALLCQHGAEAVERKLVASGSLNKTGWKHVYEHFVPRFGHKYSMNQLKTKWRALAKHYKLWSKLLKSITGIGWDEETGTLLADDEWWNSRIQENPDYRQIRYQTISYFHMLEPAFAPLRDFSKHGRAAADLQSHEETGTQGTDASQGRSAEVQHSQGSIQGGRESYMDAAPYTTACPNTHPSASRASGLPRSFFKSPEFSERERGKTRLYFAEEQRHMGQITEYLTTGARAELAEYGQFVRDPTDLGTVMQAVAELPGVTFGSTYWMEALRYFESHDRACASFLRACTTIETKVEYLRHALGK